MKEWNPALSEKVDATLTSEFLELPLQFMKYNNDNKDNNTVTPC